MVVMIVNFWAVKAKLKKITCTLELAKKVPYYIATLANYQLKTVAELGYT
ncbi:MAG: 3'-5' exonuclease [Microcystis sp.]